MAVPPPTKAERRAEALARRVDYARSLTGKVRAAMEARFVARLAERLDGARIIGSYHPMRAEISAMALPDMLPGKTFAFPWFAARDAVMMFREGPVSVAGVWGILQPALDAPAAAPDAVVVPLVLADRAGNRIGHGKGHYDRALANLRAASHKVRLIGAAWDLQVSDLPITPDPWDIALDAIATPNEWIECK